MDDNVWEYPFGDLDDDDEVFDQHLNILGPLTKMHIMNKDRRDADL
jgi:hypothetical protein